MAISETQRRALVWCPDGQRHLWQEGTQRRAYCAHCLLEVKSNDRPGITQAIAAIATEQRAAHEAAQAEKEVEASEASGVLTDEEMTAVQRARLGLPEHKAEIDGPARVSDIREHRPAATE